MLRDWRETWLTHKGAGNRAFRSFGPMMGRPHDPGALCGVKKCKSGAPLRWWALATAAIGSLDRGTTLLGRWLSPLGKGYGQGCLQAAQKLRRSPHVCGSQSIREAREEPIQHFPGRSYLALIRPKLCQPDRGA